MKKGAAWELQLSLWNEEYRRRGHAKIFRCHPGVNLVGGRLIYASKGPPDFLGCLAGGRSIVFDAKEVSAPTFAFANLAPHQADAFDSVTEMGGIAAIAIQWMNGHVIVGRSWVPWSSLSEDYRRWRTEKGSKASFRRAERGLEIPPEGWLALV